MESLVSRSRTSLIASFMATLHFFLVFLRKPGSRRERGQYNGLGNMCPLLEVKMLDNPRHLLDLSLDSGGDLDSMNLKMVAFLDSDTKKL